MVLFKHFQEQIDFLNDTKPYGNILDFRSQQDRVNEAITLFSGESGKKPKEIWLVDSASKDNKEFPRCN